MKNRRVKLIGALGLLAFGAQVENQIDDDLKRAAMKEGSDLFIPQPKASLSHSSITSKQRKKRTKRRKEAKRNNMRMRK